VDVRISIRACELSGDEELACVSGRVAPSRPVVTTLTCQRARHRAGLPPVRFQSDSYEVVEVHTEEELCPDVSERFAYRGTATRLIPLICGLWLACLFRFLNRRLEFSGAVCR